MATCSSFQVQMTSIMEVLAKTAVAEITKLVDDESAALRFEMCRSLRENEALKNKLLLMERELRAVRGYGEGAPENSLNISFEVQVCEEFKEAQRSKDTAKGRVVVERVLDERLSPGPARDDQNVVVEKNSALDALDLKYEVVDGDQDWSESLLLSEDELEEDPKGKQSQVEQKISEENTCGTLGSAPKGDEGPLSEEEEEELPMQACSGRDLEKGLRAELKQEQEQEQEQEVEPPSLVWPQLGSEDLGLRAQPAWGKADGRGMAWEKHGLHRGSSAQGHTSLDGAFSHLHYRGFRGLRLETDEGPASHLDLQQNGCPLEGTRLICTHCGRFFDGVDSLKQHCLAHHKEKWFSCAVCRKVFGKKFLLKSHQGIHTGEKPFHCLKCGKSFAHQSNLRSHQSVHTGEKPHRCKECGKGFAHAWNLKTHQRIHTGEKPYTCTLCGRGFSQNHTLQKHLLTHSR